MKSFCLMILVCMVFVLSGLSGASAALIEAANCSQLAVQETINNAGDGDTVIIPDGQCTWNGDTLVIAKAITLKGNGVYSMPAYNSGPPHPHPDNGAWPLTIDLSGYGTSSSAINIQATTGSLVRVTGIRFTGGAGSMTEGPITIRESNTVPWRIDNCKFSLSGGQSIITRRSDMGLIDHNYFDKGATCDTLGRIMIQDLRGQLIDTLGHYLGAQPFTWGGSDFVFIEDNSFVRTGCTGCAAMADIDTGYSGKAVIRHNYFYEGQLTFHGTGSGSNGRSIVASEVYNNVWYMPFSFSCDAFGCRGGTHLVHNNEYTNYAYIIRMWEPERVGQDRGTWDYCDGSNVLDGNWLSRSNDDCVGEGDPYSCCIDVDAGVCGGAYPAGYPCIDQPGWAKSAGYSYWNIGVGTDLQPQAAITSGSDRLSQYPIRIWNNTRYSTGTACSGGLPDCSGNLYVVSNRDYYYCDDDSCAEPGYIPYPYPHPLQSVGAEYTCGTDGVDNSCTPAGLQTLIDSAYDGDTIHIATGTHDWSSIGTPGVQIDKCITISGGGSCSDCGTTTTPSGTWPTTIDLGVTTSNQGFFIEVPDNCGGNTVRITGLYLTGRTYNYYGYATTSDSVFIVVGEDNQATYRIDNNHFYDHGGGTEYMSSSMILSQRLAYGIVDNNYFQLSDARADGHFIYTHNLDIGCGNFCEYGQTRWAEPPGWGGNNFLFIEDNTFRIECGTSQPWGPMVIDGDNGAKAVIRHNYMRNCGISFHAHTGHDWSRAGYAFEIYNNTIRWESCPNYNDYGQAPIYIRGGTYLIHNNIFEDAAGIEGWRPSAIRFTVDRIRSCGQSEKNWGMCDDATEYDWDGNWGGAYPTGYPCLDSPGRGQAAGDDINGADVQPQASEPVRIWNNINNLDDEPLVEVASCASGYVEEGRDYYASTDDASRPAGYTPYPYPHPLASGTSLPTCSEQGGTCCQAGESCLGSSQQASDCTVCCITGSCEAPAPTCQSQGYQCCNACQTTHYSQYDSDCPGQVCCDACFSPTQLSVTLDSPSDRYTSASNQIDFMCSATDPADVQSISLYGNWSGWHQDEKYYFANNLLNNPGFENGFSGGIAQNWFITSDGSTSYSASQDSGYVGSSQRIDVTTIGSWGLFLYQTPSFQLNEWYTWSLWYKTQGSEEAWAQVGNAPLSALVHSEHLPGTGGEWRYKSISFQYDNPSADQMRFSLYEPGSFWFDNVQLEVGQVNHSFSPSSSQTSASHTFSKTLVTGSYEWNCLGENSASETAWGEPGNRILVVGGYHPADTSPQDGCITMQELSGFITQWYLGNVPMLQLMEAIKLWKAGAGC